MSFAILDGTECIPRPQSFGQVVKEKPQKLEAIQADGILTS